VVVHSRYIGVADSLQKLRIIVRFIDARCKSVGNILEIEAGVKPEAPRTMSGERPHIEPRRDHASRCIRRLKGMA
jgi:hypothetical protein